MPILYSLRSHPAGYMIAKFDADFNVAAIYLITVAPPSPGTHPRYICECPAGPRPTCKHRKMVPIFVAAKAVDTDKFYCYETQTWHQPIPTSGEGDPSAALASAASVRAAELVDENACPGHVASANDPMVCGRCGVHIDSLRPDDYAGEGPGPSPLAVNKRASPSTSRRSEPAPALRRLK